MLKQFYSISGRENFSIDARVKFLLDQGGDINQVSAFLSRHYDPIKTKEAINFYYTGKHKLPVNGSGTERKLENSTFAIHIPEIKQFLTDHNNDYVLAKDYFKMRYNVNSAFVYLVANSMGIDTSGKNLHTKNTFKDTVPEIIEMFKNGASIREVYEKYKHINISRNYITALHTEHAPKENKRVRKNYGHLKDEIIKRLKAGESAEELSEKYGVRKKMIEDWRRMYVGYIYNV